MYKGQLEGFPPEIVEKMLWYQEQQGNKRDVTVFENYIKRCKLNGGFNWVKTDEKFKFWDNVINNKNFDLFFEKYPKKQYEYEVVHCETQEQWDFVRAKTTTRYSKEWDEAIKQNKNIAIEIDGSGWDYLERFKRRNSLIYSFEQWCEKFGHTFKEEFKIGDWVVILDNKEVGESIRNQCVKIVNIFNNLVSFTNSTITGRLQNKFVRKALPHEIPQSLNPCQEIVLHKPYSDKGLNDLKVTKLVAGDVTVFETQDEITITTKEYKVEDGYLPYPEQPIDLSSILSSLNY